MAPMSSAYSTAMQAAYSGCTAAGAVRAYTTAAGSGGGRYEGSGGGGGGAGRGSAEPPRALQRPAHNATHTHTGPSQGHAHATQCNDATPCAKHPPAHSAAGASRQTRSSPAPSCGRHSSAAASAFGSSSDSGPAGGGCDAAAEKACGSVGRTGGGGVVQSSGCQRVQCAEGAGAGRQRMSGRWWCRRRSSTRGVNRASPR